MKPPAVGETLTVHTVEKLAPTGEGLVRTNEGVGLVEGALPGEEVDIEVVRVSKKIWWGRAAAVRSPSPARLAGGHAEGCPACDWAHFEPGAAREAKRSLFFETMGRIGRFPARLFEPLPIEPSPPGYRLRSRFHAAALPGGRVVVGAFAPRTHRVEPLDACEALSPAMREALPKIEAALAGAPVPSELSVVEDLEGARRIAQATLRDGAAEAGRVIAALEPLFDGLTVVSTADSAGRSRLLERTGEPRLWLEISGRPVAAAPDVFFQANRFLVGPLVRRVRELAAAVPPGRALDAFGGSGLFAGALLDAGHSVASVEGDAAAAELARLARDRWGVADRWRVVRSSVLDHAAKSPGREDVVVADPPRAGLGLPLARALAQRTERLFVYVSCDPSTLARDLAVLVEEGFEIRSARLFDLFAFTHRVEAVVSLERVRPSRA